MQTHPDVAGARRASDSVEKFKRVSEAYSILGNQNERRRYDFETSVTGIQDLRNRRAAAAASARGAGAGGGMGSGSFAATLPRNLVIGGMLGFAGVTALRTMWPTKEEEDGGGAAWTSRTGQKRLVEAWKNPSTGRWETPRPWDPMYQKLQPSLQLVPRDEVDDSKGRR
jgi:DnaJ-class molecular chaperone